MKYDELIKSLHICGDNTASCRGCLFVKTPLNVNCRKIIMNQAADAIEELTMKLHGDEAAIAGMKQQIERMVVNSGNKPKWIPVTERLPMRNTKVLLAYKQGVTLGYLGAYPKEGEKAYFHGIHGWKHTLSSVTHWQYLPEPPKEETDG